MKRLGFSVFSPLLLAFFFAACGGGGGGDDGPLVFPVSPEIVPFATANDVIAPVYGVALFESPAGARVDGATNQLLVTMDAGFQAGELAALVAEIEARGGRVVGQIPSLRVLQAEMPENADVEQALVDLAILPGVFHASPNISLTLLKNPIPDPRTAGEGWWLDAIRAPEAWDVTTGDAEVPVGIVDSGLDVLANHIAAPRITFFTTTDGDQGSHGTAVSSLLVSDGLDAACAVGMAWENPLFVADAYIAARGAVLLTDVLRGGRLVLDAGARVANVALGPFLPNGVPGTKENFLALRREWRAAATPLIRRAAEKDALIVWGSGNAGLGADPNHQPGDPDHVPGTTLYDDDLLLPPGVPGAPDMEELWNDHAIIVAGIGENLAPSDFSVGGAVIGLSAPAEDVHLGGPNGQCTTGTGTSFAAPLVAGTAALILGVAPDLSAPEIRQILLATAHRPNGWDTSHGGAGILDAAAAVEAASAD